LRLFFLILRSVSKPLQSGLLRVSKDGATVEDSWFETAFGLLTTMRALRASYPHSTFAIPYHA
jgi:hypothetical protein